MNGQKALFWSAIIAQVVGAQVFFWDALPDYRELTAGARGQYALALCHRGGGAFLRDDAIGLSVRRRLQPEIRFRHRVVLGHLLLCLSEVSFFFVSALATVAAFDHWKRSRIRPVESDAG